MEFYLSRLKGNISFMEQYSSSYFLCILLSGKLTVRIYGETHTLNDGQYIVIAQINRTICTLHGRVRLAFILIGGIDFLTPYLTNYPLLFIAVITDSHLAVFSLKKGQRLPVAGLLSYLWYRFRKEMPIEHKFPEYLFAGLRLLFRELHENLIIKLLARSYHAEKLFLDFLTELKRNKGKKHRVGYYASKLYVSKTYLRKVVKEVSGNPPRFYIVTTILFESKRLLYTAKPIKEISDDMGFNTIYHFSSFFTKYVGIPPSVFREQSTD
ncbi:helix-turn-helix domain-containing protein [Galbibacter sp. PAP.153]|uniref:helix-turn-helix domain-containing protein n=1 Tax=Galbibacter sp. PAP.153 TaxID=3104623 RepID=UPI00300A334E